MKKKGYRKNRYKLEGRMNMECCRQNPLGTGDDMQYSLNEKQREKLRLAMFSTSCMHCQVRKIDEEINRNINVY